MNDGSVTGWIQGLGHHEPDPPRRIVERYLPRLARLARAKLRHVGRAASDEEDVAIDAFDSFFRGASAGRFKRLANRDDLWQVLAMLAARKSIDLVEREGRQKRGGGRTLNEADLGPSPGGSTKLALDDLAGAGPSPDLDAEAVEEFRRLLDLLDDESLQRVAVRKLEGYSHEEIRAELGCSLRTVTNKVELIRRIWSESAGGGA